MNLLCSMGLRGFPLQEVCHPQWNDYLRAADAARMKLSVLKLTLLVNSGRGPYHSGRNQFTIERATYHLLSACDDEYLQSLAESVWRDKGCQGHGPPRVTKEDWLQAPGIRTRLKQVHVDIKETSSVWSGAPFTRFYAFASRNPVARPRTRAGLASASAFRHWTRHGHSWHNLLGTRRSFFTKWTVERSHSMSQPWAQQ